MSTFHGLEMAKQALFAQQSALHTTGHNISNANTEGYTRQRVDFESAPAYPAISRNHPVIAGQIGTGVRAGSVQRIRNEYLDDQFRGENSKVGYWQARSGALSRMENLLNEPSETGLSASLDQFWQSLQDLAVNPENSGARSVVVQRGQALAETVNYLSDSLLNIRADIKGQINTTLKDANTITNQINEINQQVKRLETNGYTANDLYDRRDKLIDELSNIVDIDVQYDTSHTESKTVDGVATIRIVNDVGDEVATLVDGMTDTVNKFAVNDEIDYVLDPESGIESIHIDGTESRFNINKLLQSEGSLKGLVEAYGYQKGEETIGLYPDMLANLEKLATNYIDEFNMVHEEGYGIANESDEMDNKGNAFLTLKEKH
ncbi:flagellar hook-associated protein FlgK [Oceanobacillus senegalensis]|uniref:flagellar hook-associated protein FlgK n=1 Tax=Oceanobacillus senegalensis TaxID=1936063 RepID=UPI001FE9558B|nr:flagellar hook-associated protein FlgK [Oceanobacillus senegalensis]